MTGDRWVRWAGALAVAVVTAAVLLLAVVLIAGAVTAPPSGVGSALMQATAGSAAAVALALAVAAPLGVAAGMVLAGAEPGESGIAVALLDGAGTVPGVVYGLAGAVVFAAFAPTVWGAGLVLAAVALPGMVRATERSVRRVSVHEREAAMALGATRFQVVVRVVLPGARRDIAAAVLASGARVLGEAAPLLALGAVAAHGEGMSAVPLRLWALAASGIVGREAYALAVGLTVVVLALTGASLWLRRAREPVS